MVKMLVSVVCLLVSGAKCTRFSVDAGGVSKSNCDDSLETECPGEECTDDGADTNGLLVGLTSDVCGRISSSQLSVFDMYLVWLVVVVVSSLSGL